MNLSTLALALLACKLLCDKNTSAPKTMQLTDFLSADTKSLLDGFAKLQGDGDKMGVLLQMMSNPTLMNLAQNIFQKPNDLANSEGYKFESPSQQAQEFFRPIENIADAEVKHKLYNFFDNWYLK